MVADYHDQMSSIAASFPLPSPSLTLRQMGAARLDEWGVIEAHGADAASFLQGQLTQDVLGLPIGRWRLAGYCSAKGRLLASFWLLRVEADRYWLLCSADLLAPTLKRLKMFVLRAKCQLSDRTADFQVWGITQAVTSAAASLGVGPVWPDRPSTSTTWGWQLGLPTVAGVSRELWLISGGPDTGLPAPGLTQVEPQTWRWLEVASGMARIVAATVEQFVPQMVNFEAVGGVSFQKGCYPGQEVVARSQYRGTLKRRTSLWQTAQVLMPGQDVHASDAPPDAEPVGRVVLAATAGAGSIALIESTTDAAQSPSGWVDRQGQQLKRLALPYDIPPQD